jgi:hypothetical protein
MISWLSSKQLTRITSYSVRNSIESSTTQPHSPLSPTASNASKLLIATTPIAGNDTAFAAFKVLPIDPARSRRQTGSFIEPADEFASAKTCRDAVDLMVDAIAHACKDAGSGHKDGLVLNADVVRLVQLLLPDACSVWVRGADLVQFGRSEAKHERVREDGVWCETVALAWWVILRGDRLG